VYSKDLENLTPLPPEHLRTNKDSDISKNVPEFLEQTQNDLPATAQQSFSSATMDDEIGERREDHTTCSARKARNDATREQPSEEVINAIKGLDEKFTTLNRRLSELPGAPKLDRADIQSKNKEISELNKTKADLEQRNNELVSALSCVNSKLLEQRQQFLAEKDNMIAELDLHKSIRKDLELALQESQEKRDLLESEMIPDSTKQLQEAVDKLQEYEKQLEEMTQKNMECDHLIKSLKSENEKLCCDLEDEKKRMLSITEDSHTAYKEEQEANKTKNAIIQNLENALATMKQDLKEQQSLLAERSNELRNVMGQLKAASDERTQLQKSLATATEQIQKDSGINNEKLLALKELKEQNRHLHNRLEEMEAQVKFSRTERDDAILRLGTSDQRENELIDKLRECDRVRKEMHARLMVLIGSIRTFVRVRPSLPEEMDSLPPKQKGIKENIKEEIFSFSGINGGSQISKSSKYGCDDPTKNLVSIQEPWKDRGGLSQRRKKWTFGFDQVFAPQSSQEDVWEATEPLVQSTVDGFNVTIFAYGQTGSGKTHTMFGRGDSTSGHEGIISRAIRKLFNTKREIEELSQGAKFAAMKVEMLEIYNENVRDLLACPAGADELGASLKVVGSEAVGSIRQPVESEAEVFKIVKTAEKRRCVKATNSNATSSRSHLVFSVEFSVFSKDGSVHQVGKLNVCDLAGSERVSKTGAVGSILEEAKHINLSLSTLSNVIEKLQAGEKNVPFRDSKLTALLQNSLEGNSKTLCIVCCSPRQTNFHVSFSRASQI
jgi:kinesin family member C1